jgi:polyketide cyclase/dehydrase/lipid transport protein
MAPTYSYSHVVEADVDPAAVWALYDDVSTWPAWDAQAEWVTRDGPFATGSSGAMKFRGMDAVPYRLARVEPLREFVDETPLGDLVVRVSHVLEPLASGRLRVTYAAEIDGPEEQAAQVGPAITADFPETMAALLALAKERSA